MNFVEGGVTAPKGFKASGIHCGIKKAKKDLGLIVSEKECYASAVYTTNRVKGAPIEVTKANLVDQKAHAVIVNSGNANTCNSDGVEKAERMCELVAEKLGLKKDDFIIASTGVIGQPLNIEVIESGIDDLVSNLSENNGGDVAESIMTTDTIKKEVAVKCQIGDKEVSIGAIAKGSGMINPNMATLLVFVTTDVNITGELLDKAFKDAVNYSLNRISVDGDTSTNDMASIMANGLAGNKEINMMDSNYDIFVNALKDLMVKISKMLAQDGEGATKLIECQVVNAKNEIDAVKLAKTVIMSSLVKSAMFGNDANWGRVLCALGYSEVDFDEKIVDVKFKSSVGEVLVCKDGSYVEFSEELAEKIISEKEVVIYVDIKQGNKDGFAFGCDLTYDYVKINGSYRT